MDQMEDTVPIDEEDERRRMMGVLFVEEYVKETIALLYFKAEDLSLVS